MDKLERANKRLHFRRAIQGVRKAFAALDKAMSELHVEDLRDLSNGSVELISGDYDVWAKEAIAELKPLVPFQ